MKSMLELQQLLPFTVLKLICIKETFCLQLLLQQLLPFTVLKRYRILQYKVQQDYVATALTVYGIET